MASPAYRSLQTFIDRIIRSVKSRGFNGLEISRTILYDKDIDENSKVFNIEFQISSRGYMNTSLTVRCDENTEVIDNPDVRSILRTGRVPMKPLKMTRLHPKYDEYHRDGVVMVRGGDIVLRVSSPKKMRFEAPTGNASTRF